jgi:anti-sigma factor RsiW
VFYWVDRDLGYALSAKLGRKQLLRIADGVYRQITL